MLHESEAVTRRKRIDPKLKALGWIAVPFVNGMTKPYRHVEALSKQTDAIEERSKIAHAFIEKLTPSVPSKVFRGELV